MLELKRILACITHDQDNTQVLQRTLQVAKQSGAVVELFCPAYNRALHQSYLFDKKAEQHAEHGYIKQVEKQLEQYAGQLTEQGVACGYDVYWERHPAEGIVRKAERDEPDLVISALESRHGLARLFSRDGDKRLVRECPAPLLLTYGEPWPQPLRVAVCVDPMHACDNPGALDHAAIDAAVSLRQLMAVELRVVHCYHTLPHAVIFDEHVVTDYAALQDRVRHEHIDQLNHLLLPLNLTVASPEVAVIEGEAHKALPEYAQQQGIDLMVMGYTERDVVDRFLSGSTLERVMGALECDILVIKAHSG